MVSRPLLSVDSVQNLASSNTKRLAEAAMIRSESLKPYQPVTTKPRYTVNPASPEQPRKKIA